jgi:hypothetical protein
MIIGVDVLKWYGGELRGKSALHPDWNRRSLLQRRVWLRAFIFILVVIPNLSKHSQMQFSFLQSSSEGLGPYYWAPVAQSVAISTAAVTCEANRVYW